MQFPWQTRYFHWNPFARTTPFWTVTRSPLTLRTTTTFTPLFVFLVGLFAGLALCHPRVRRQVRRVYAGLRARARWLWVRLRLSCWYGLLSYANPVAWALWARDRPARGSPVRRPQRFGASRW
ncbi:hypothetical protein F4780DRAFT_781887 [Xylariomycetidae sp. FL0641]|nr:hypothetical protein F4780DRAFT_781887 [Xylariomycetidae sp. FL0641]